MSESIVVSDIPYDQLAFPDEGTIYISTPRVNEKFKEAFGIRYGLDNGVQVTCAWKMKNGSSRVVEGLLVLLDIDGHDRLTISYNQDNPRAEVSQARGSGITMNYLYEGGRMRDFEEVRFYKAIADPRIDAPVAAIK